MTIEEIEIQDKCPEKKVREVCDTNLSESLNSKAFHSFFRLFKLIGITISQSNSSLKRCCCCCRYFLLTFLFINSLFSCLYQLGNLFNGRPIDKYSSGFIGFTDHYIVFFTIYIVAFRHQKINSIVNDQLRLVSQYSTNILEVKKSIQKWIYFCYVIAFFQFVIETCYHSYTFVDYNLIESFLWYAHAIQSGVILLQILCSDIFYAFVIYNLFIMSLIYQQLNKKFKNEKKKDIKSYMNEHMKLAEAIDRFNQILSPALLVLVIVNILQIVTTADELISLDKDMRPPFYQNILRIILRLFKTLVSLITITSLGHQLKNEVQNGISILLETSMSNSDSKISEDEDRQNKNIDMTAQLLFATKMTSSPVVINASNLLVIDNTMIPILISTAITYLTIMSTNKDTPCCGKGDEAASSRIKDDYVNITSIQNDTLNATDF